MTELPKSTNPAETTSNIPERPVDESQIQDLGLISLESVRLQYPQPKPFIVRLRKTPLDIPRSTMEPTQHD